jgi:hypothetical protein
MLAGVWGIFSQAKAPAPLGGESMWTTFRLTWCARPVVQRLFGFIYRTNRLTWASAADQGVRPTLGYWLDVNGRGVE